MIFFIWWKLFNWFSCVVVLIVKIMFVLGMFNIFIKKRNIFFKFCKLRDVVYLWDEVIIVVLVGLFVILFYFFINILCMIDNYLFLVILIIIFFVSFIGFVFFFVVIIYFFVDVMFFNLFKLVLVLMVIGIILILFFLRGFKVMLIFWYLLEDFLFMMIIKIFLVFGCGEVWLNNFLVFDKVCLRLGLFEGCEIELKYVFIWGRI